MTDQLSTADLAGGSARNRTMDTATTTRDPMADDRDATYRDDRDSTFRSEADDGDASPPGAGAGEPGRNRWREDFGERRGAAVPVWRGRGVPLPLG
jgi:hypothetical protein